MGDNESYKETCWETTFVVSRKATLHYTTDAVANQVLSLKRKTGDHNERNVRNC